MKIVPEFVADFFRKKPSENLLRAAERSRLRQSQSGRYGDGFSQPADSVTKNPQNTEFAKNQSGGIDTKTLVLAVSLAANAGLAGVLYGKSTVSDENERLRGEVQSLRTEKDKAVRFAKGKITLAPNQLVVNKEDLDKYSSSATLLIESTKALSERVVELEGRLASYEGRKTVEKPVGTAKVSNAAPEVRKASNVSALARKAVKQVSRDMPEWTSLKVVEAADKTLVVYADATGYSRYFTADNADNFQKLTEKGLTEWANKKYIESIDAQAKAQGAKS